MSYQEKKIVTTLATGAAVLAAYCLYAFGQSGPGATAPEDLKAWAVAMLAFVGVSVVAGIVIQVVFHILLSVSIAAKEASSGRNEFERAISAEIVDDERDKSIDVKFSRISLACCCAGFVAGLAALALGYSPVVMINLMYIVFSAGCIVESAAKLRYYRRSADNG